MVDRQCAVLSRHHRATEVTELLDMRLDRQTQPLSRGKYPRTLFHTEGDRFNKHIYRVDQAFGMRRWQHFVAHQIDVSITATRVFGRQRVGTCGASTSCSKPAPT